MRPRFRKGTYRVRPQLRRAQHPEGERVSNKAAPTQLAETLRRQPAQTLVLRSHAICASAATDVTKNSAPTISMCPLPTTSIANSGFQAYARTQCSAHPLVCKRSSKTRATAISQIANVTFRQTQTHESSLLRGKRAALPADMGSLDPGCSGCVFPEYATA